MDAEERKRPEPVPPMQPTVMGRIPIDSGGQNKALYHAQNTVLAAFAKTRQFNDAVELVMRTNAEHEAITSERLRMFLTIP